MNTKIFARTVLSIAVASLALAACSPAQVSPTPTQINVEAIQTQVAATIFAGQTGTASAMPTNTSTATTTSTLTATVTTTPTVTKVYVAPPVQPVNTIAITTTGTPGTLVPSATATLGGVGCNNSAFIEDVTVPNNSQMAAGKTFTKTWRIKNTGTCNWSNSYRFTFVGGELFGSDTTKIRRNVGPGSTTDFSLSMVAPSSPGAYTSSWRMADESSKLFGAVFSFTIIVPGETNTPSPTDTETPVPTTYP